jgi:Na+/H+-dicarboxylate symporter
VTGFLLHVIPTTFFEAFSQGEILPVLFVSVLFGIALVMVGELRLAGFRRLRSILGSWSGPSMAGQ